MNRIRQERIKRYVESRSIATIKELRELFPEVSLMTIHRDLDSLESQGVITKYRGGVKSVHYPEDVDFDVRLKENNEGKLSMMKKAMTLIEPHSSVFLDAGTSNLFLARNLPDINLNIVTTGLGIALELSRLRNPQVTVCGGTMNRKNLAIYGQNTIEMLEKINIDTALIGVSGCSADTGFTCGTEADMLIKRTVIKKARVRVMMCGAEKFRRLMPYTFATMDDADYIVADGPIPDEFLKAAQKAGVIIL